MTIPSDSYFSKSLEKGLTILNLFDREHTRRSLAEISRITGINKTSAFRFVNTLVALGYLKKSKNKLLKLGPKALLLGNNFVQGFDLLQSIKPLIDKNFLQYNVTIDSALLHDLTLISLYRRETANLTHLRLPLVMNDLHARAMGKAVLAHLGDNDLERFFHTCPREKLTPKTLVDKKDLVSDLVKIRKRGYAVNNEEYVTGLICMGAALMDFRTESVVGAISFDFPSSEFSLKDIEHEYTGVVTKLANHISEIITMSDS